MTESIFKVAVEAPLKDSLSYLAPSELKLQRGQSVEVPLGKRRIQGVVLGPGQNSTEFSLKEIFQAVEDRPVLSESFLRWTEWLSNYYLHPHGKILESVFPPLKREGRAKKNRAPIVPQLPPEPPPHLTSEQRNCIQQIQSQPKFAAHLLFGVTGSGKTEVYLQLIEEVRQQQKQALVLVPEISLTPQLISRFSKRFPNEVAVIHSHLTDREKTDQWWSIVSKEKSILIGARSALFCPMQNLGLIIVDEEHESSYKQDEKLRYHARDAAIMLAKFTDVPIVLGSATPSLESWNNVLGGKYQLHEMKNRVATRRLPIIQVIDMKDERALRRDEVDPLPFWLSRPLFNEIEKTLAAKEQTALFLNRRGMAQTLHCEACGHVEECPNCAVSLTLHAREHLVCHYCGFTKAKGKKCGQCKTGEVVSLGIGTEAVEDDLRKLFPTARLARADRDEISSRQDLEELIRGMELNEIDILIGTQMIAKGLDFPHLTLVGLVMADIGFHLPDFRSSERSFQLMTQVSGRAGRHSVEPGRVIIQTYNPDHPSIVHTIDNRYREFAEIELRDRRRTSYPPFSRLALFKISGSDLNKTLHCAQAVQLRAERAGFSDAVILGPAPSPLAKLRGKYRFQVLIKHQDSNRIHQLCLKIMADESWIPSATKVQIDIDPLHML